MLPASLPSIFFSRNRAGTQQAPVLHDTAWMLTDTTNVVATLSRSGLKDLVRRQEPMVRVTCFSDNLQDLCSYSTDPASTNTIFVPGAPRRYRVPALSTAFGQQLITAPTQTGSSNNATTSTTTPASFASFNPLLRALRLTDPTQSLRGTHIVTDRITLHQLLSFTRRAGPTRPFRLHLVRKHDTLFLVRSAKHAAMLLGDEAGHSDGNTGDDKLDEEDNDDDDESRAYRRGFRARFTTPMADDESDAATVAEGAAAARHYRVVSYNFGTLKLVVRVDVDAVLRDDPNIVQQQTGAMGTVDKVAANLAREEAANAAVGITAEVDARITAFAQGPEAEVQREEVADLWLRKQKRTFLERLTSRTDSSRFRIRHWLEPQEPRGREVLPRSWFGRTAFVVQGMHLAGTISEEPVTGRPSARWDSWEDGYKDHLKRVHKLLEWLRDMVVEEGVGQEGGAVVGRAILVCEVLNGQGTIKVYGVREGAVIETLDERDVAGLWPTEA